MTGAIGLREQRRALTPPRDALRGFCFPSLPSSRSTPGQRFGAYLTAPSAGERVSTPNREVCHERTVSGTVGRIMKEALV